MSDPITRLNSALEGRYHIERQIGEGGMATVYLADDLRHERKVALKVLKPELAAVVGAERFLAEIKTTANLQHPHILPLFDSGEADSFLFYVMPYVEGETLRERLQRENQLPVDEAVSIAKAVAQALQHAHDRGVIHRDIKPGNILMQDGQPVVSDFGIALAVGSAGGTRLTETGLSVGTPYYMSPEQATGDVVVGPASDLYALACVLYEMLTGDPPYIGSTAQAVLGKILQGVPVSATGVRKAVPLNVDAAIRKALEKLPADRFSGAQEFARALGDPGYRYGAEASATASRGGLWNPLSMAASAAAILFAAGFAWALTSAPAPTTELQASRRFEIEIGPTAPFAGSQVHAYPALSPDGSLLVYSASLDGEPARLYLRRLDQLGVRSLEGTEGAYAPFFSPDGQWIGFQDGANRILKKVAVQGGQPLELAYSWAPLGAAWLEDGTIVYVSQDEQAFTGNGAGAALWRVSDSGGTPERLTTVDLASGEGYHAFPHALPDGNTILFSSLQSDGSSLGIRALSLETGEHQMLVQAGHDARYTPSGHLVFARQGALWAERFDPDRLEALGREVVVLQALEVGALAVPYTFSSDGLLAYMPGETGLVVGAGGAPRTLVWVDREGREQPVPLPVRAFEGPELSPDGQRIAVAIQDGTDSDLWVYDLVSGASLRLTRGGVNLFKTPVWSRDGRRIYFGETNPTTGSIDVFAVPSDGSGEPEQMLASDATDSPTDISPDGTALIFRRAYQDGSTDLTAVQLDGEPAETRVIGGDFMNGNASISPDGRWLAYFSDESGRREVYIQPYPGPGAKIPVSIGGGQEVRWSEDGSELYYRNGQSLMAVSVQSGSTISVSQPRPLFVDVYRNGFALNGAREYDVAPDGRFLMMSEGVTGPDANQDQYDHFVVVNNWFDELHRLLPED